MTIDSFANVLSDNFNALDIDYLLANAYIVETGSTLVTHRTFITLEDFTFNSECIVANKFFSVERL